MHCTGLTGALVRLQGRADTVIGFPADPPAPPPANAGALSYVRSIVTNQPAHKAMLASMRAIEAEILKHHPDRVDPREREEATRVAAEINAAYDTLIGRSS